MAAKKEVKGEEFKTVESDGTLLELKRQKTRAKTSFTKSKNKLLDHAESDALDAEGETLLKKLQNSFDNCQEEANYIMEELCHQYKKKLDRENENKVLDEIDKLNEDYSNTMSEVREYNRARRKDVDKEKTREATVSKGDLEKDLWRQMKRVSIPVFHGDKKKYQEWKMAFTACIDKTPATPEYKLLQLRQYLAGDALNVIEGLGHSEAAYDAAKERLDRKFGGDRRQISKFWEELDNFPTIRTENPKLIEKFSDLLDIAIINMKDMNLKDLDSNFMYINLLRKLPESMITRFNRWLGDSPHSPETILSLRDWVVRESEYLTAAAEVKHGLNFDKSAAEKTYYGQPEMRYQERNKKCCKMCLGQHGIWECPSFKELSEPMRWTKVKDMRLCFRCLGDNHFGKSCLWSRHCGIGGCNKNHHQLLHNSSESWTARPNPARPNPKATIISNKSYQPPELNQSPKHPDDKVFTITGKKNIALRTVPIIVSGNNRKVNVNALLDDGSTKSYVSSNVAARLGLKEKTQCVQVNVLSGKQTTFETMPVTIGVESISGHIKMNMDVNTIDNVTGNLRAVDWNKHSESWEHLKGLEFPVIDRDNQVEMLIGLDYADLHTSLHEIRGKPGEPIARLTPLGWTCVGDLDNDKQGTTDTLFSTYFVKEESTEMVKLLRGFWDVDSYGTERKDQQPLSPIDKKVLDTTYKTMTYTAENRYEVGIPWKQTPELKTSNYQMAVRRLKSTEKKLREDPGVADLYQQTLDKYEAKGYIRRVPQHEQTPEAKWYLPHFPVVRPEKETTKVRIVFDAAAKSEGMCLNDFIHQGPKLQTDLFDVLLRFRKNETALVCDISEMYLQVGIIESDRRFHRFLWNSSSIEEYEFNRLVFGVNCSPFLAQFVSRENATCHSDMYPAAAETVLRSTYMDDSMTSVDQPEEGVELYNQLSSLWRKAGMFARKWLSNSRQVLEQIPQEERATEVDLDTGYLPTTKTLGVTWRADSDVFIFKLNHDTKLESITKRSVLKVVARLFDPIGFLSPLIVRGKIILQMFWSSGLEWDESADSTLARAVTEWLRGFPALNKVAVQRSLKFGPTHKSSIIHVFVDASSEAYGTVIYVRHEANDDSIVLRFVSSKTRVAPLNTMSIPRLELMAAILGLRLALAVTSALETVFQDVVFWTDSVNVLWWIHGQSRRYKPFVANRIGEIHDKSEPRQWRYVPTKDNPADIASRGLSAEELVDCSLWWEGPSFLQYEQSKWPKKDMISKLKPIEDTELKNLPEEATFSACGAQCVEDRLDPNRFSDWIHLCRVMGWVLRFVNNCQTKTKTTGRELSRDEILGAEKQLILKAQIDSFSQEYNCLEKGHPLPNTSKLAPLNVKLDVNGIMRCDSRLKYADFLPYNARFPVILPRKHRITKLVVKHYHELGDHYGTNQTLAALSSRFWIIAAREEIREWEKECAVCKRQKAHEAEQQMAPLPEARLGKTMRAFAYCSVDYGGPFVTKQGRGKSRQKRYLCLFTCMSSRAVHLEMAYALDTDSFLNAFYRMASRRNYPLEMYSDNGTNFVGAKNELQELFNLLDKDKIVKNGAKNGVNWFFNPPLSPHFGGVHEAMIKSAKRAVYAVLNNAEVTDEELQTAFVGAEGLINSRPIAYQSANAADDCVLTPNHFLHGQIGGQFAPESVDETVFNVKKRWRRVQEIVKHFWQRWMREFLPTLGGRKKWFKEHVDFETGDVVVVVDPDKPRGQWSIGRVCEVFPGVDGHVRVANIRVGNAILKRSISRLCMLEKSMK